MDKFYLKKDYRYIIYGAADMGKIIRKGLSSAGYQNIAAFLDRRAGSIQNAAGIAVYHPEKYTHTDCERTVVIVALTNPFEQAAVADYMHRFGYDKIVFLPFPGIKHPVEEINNLEDVYNRIQRGVITERDSFCRYTSELIDMQFSDGAVISISEEEVIAFLPVELCFSRNMAYDKQAPANPELSPEDLPAVYARQNLPVLMSHYERVNFFKAIYGTYRDVQRASNEFIQYWMNNKTAYKRFERTEQGAKDLLRNRSGVFKGMLRAFQHDGMDFFIKHPISVGWNKKGIFFVYDGGHRLSFFLALGLTSIPARINKNDYLRWINIDKLGPCISYIKEQHIAGTYVSISHPNFRFFPASHDIDGNIRIQKICEFMICNYIRVENKNVMDASSYHGYFGRFFARMGAKVTAVEPVLIKSEFSRRLNDLLYCSDIKTVCCGLDEIDTTGNFSLTVVLTALCSYPSESLRRKALRNIDTVTEDLLIWESEDHAGEEIRYILDNSGFLEYFKIGETMEKERVRELGVFSKRHITIQLPE